MLRHRLQTFRAIDLEGNAPADRPRGEDHIGEADGVIRMEMSDEHDAELRRLERSDPFLECRTRSANHARPEIDDIRNAVDDDRCRWARAVGKRLRSARSQKNDFRAADWHRRRLLCLREQWRSERE